MPNRWTSGRDLLAAQRFVFLLTVSRFLRDLAKEALDAMVACCLSIEFSPSLCNLFVVELKLVSSG